MSLEALVVEVPVLNEADLLRLAARLEAAGKANTALRDEIRTVLHRVRQAIREHGGTVEKPGPKLAVVRESDEGHSVSEVAEDSRRKTGV